MTSPKAAIRFALVVLALVLTGCMEQGAIQTGADNPLTVEGLTPSVKDKHAGLVAITPGFEITKYKVIAVEKFPVTDTAVKDGEDRQFADKITGILQVELVRRLRDSKLFDQVVNVGDSQYTASTGQPTLRLQGVVTRLGRGDRALRMWVGGGAGAARTQAEMRFVDVQTGKVVMATADRRIAKIGGGSSDLMGEAYDDMARDLGRFLVRLSRGEAPKD